MRKIIVIQHCQSEHHINNMTGGWTDTPLTELGRTHWIETKKGDGRRKLYNIFFRFNESKANSGYNCESFKSYCY